MKSANRINPEKKLFVVNTYKGINTLHINDGRCCHAGFQYEYVDFDNEQSALKAFKNNIKKCRICFHEELSVE